jgi:type I restriction enzyme, S subunit
MNNKRPTSTIKPHEIPFVLPGNWEWFKWGDLITDYQQGLIRSNRDLVADGVIYLKMNNLDGNGGYSLSNLAHTNMSEEELSKYKLYKDDFLINVRNSKELVGKTCVIGRVDDNMVYNHMLVRIKHHESISNVYINAILNTPLMKKFIDRCKKGTTTVIALYKEDLINIPIPIPDYKTQTAIIQFISSINTKIEVNQRMNVVLESMAKTLYDYWFVHNDDVDKWKVRRLGDFIKVNERSITKSFLHDEIEYIDISSVSIGRLEGTTKYSLKDAPSRARRLVKHGDTIWSTVRPNRKSYLFICNPKENLVVSTGFAVLTPMEIPPSFLYFLMTTEQFINYLVSNAEGSAYPAVSPEKFLDVKFAAPSHNKMVKFESVVYPMLAKIARNEIESKTLTELRDWLLPMLINSQVTVKQTQKVSESNPSRSQQSLDFQVPL